MGGDFDYPEALRLTFKAGQSFSDGRHQAQQTIFLMNERAVARLHLDNPLQEEFDFWGGRGPVVGVVEDFHMRSLHEPLQPTLIRLEPGHNPNILIRISPDVPGALAAIEQAWSTFAPSQPLLFSFLEEDLEAFYQAEQRLAHVFLVFASLAILIACLGLFGLVAFTAEQRTKEIGIRKVLGAERDVHRRTLVERLSLACSSRLRRRCTGGVSRHAAVAGGLRLPRRDRAGRVPAGGRLGAAGGARDGELSSSQSRPR